jgi:LemA protein
MGDIGKYIVIGGAVLIVAVIFLVIIKTRNGFVVLQNRVKNQLAQIDVQLKRRYDLIPNLLETAKGYANFERSTLEAVVKARQSAMAAANGKLQAALRRLFAVSEAYPELKANANFMQLQSELSDTENKIALSRQFYNDTVLKYNNAIQMFPASFIAGLCGFHPMSFWNAEEEARERITIQAEDMKFS